jgi:hypothetical protein
MSNHLYGQTKSKKIGLTNVLKVKNILGCDFLGFGYARCWVVNKPTTIEDESGKTNPNKANTFPRRSTWDLLVVLV